MPLTDVHIRNAKPHEKPVKLADGGGLFLMVTPHGSKLWRLAYRFAGKQKTLAIGAYAKDEVSAHGFRATASTLLNESGLWSADVIERQLAHIDGNEVRRAYARGDHWQERVKMMRWWADYLDDAKSLGAVIPMHAKQAG